MDSSSKNFEFNNDVKPVQKVEAVLRVIDNLPDTIETDNLVELSAENKLSVDTMSEAEVAQYLQDFIGRYSPGTTGIEDLMTHTMFQAVLAKAREIDAS